VLMDRVVMWAMLIIVRKFRSLSVSTRRLNLLRGLLTWRVAALLRVFSDDGA
jgi:hypothetical protein